MRVNEVRKATRESGSLPLDKNMDIQITTSNIIVFLHALFQMEYTKGGRRRIIPRKDVANKFPISISPNLEIS